MPYGQRPGPDHGDGRPANVLIDAAPATAIDCFRRGGVVRPGGLRQGNSMGYLLIRAAGAGLLWGGYRWWRGRARGREGVPGEGKIVKTEEEWRQLLTGEQFRVTRRKGT